MTEAPPARERSLSPFRELAGGLFRNSGNVLDAAAMRDIVSVKWARLSRLSLIVFFALLPAATTSTEASAAGNRSVILVVDTSGSMAGEPLIQAKQALTAAVNALPASDLAGLHQYAGACGDGGILIVPVGTGNRDRMRAAIAGLVAGGGTPTPQALRRAVSEFPASASERVIVLVSDGASGCEDPCLVVADLWRSTSVKFKAHTVGFRTTGTAETELACIAQATGGRYVAATDSAQLQDAVKVAFTEGQPDNTLLLVATTILVTIIVITTTTHIRRARRPYIKTRLAGPRLVHVEWIPQK